MRKLLALALLALALAGGVAAGSSILSLQPATGGLRELRLTEAPMRKLLALALLALALAGGVAAGSSAAFAPARARLRQRRRLLTEAPMRKLLALALLALALAGGVAAGSSLLLVAARPRGLRHRQLLTERFKEVGVWGVDATPAFARITHITAVCLAVCLSSSISEAAKMGHHPWEVQTSWEDWNSLTYPQKCVHVATPKIHQYATWTPTGKPDPAAVAACQHVTSDAAIHCLQREGKEGRSDRYTSFKAASMRIFPALTASQVRACAGYR